MGRRALLAGHFTTVGDVECLDVVRGWLDEAGVPHDTAPFFSSIRDRLDGALDLREADPDRYTHLVLVCGPVWERQLDELGLRLHRFAHCVRVGVNLSMVQPLGEWNPFDVLFERDSDSAQRPDLTLLADTAPSAVAGRCIVRRQSSYRGRERHAEAIAAFGGLARRHDLALLDIDTMWARKGNGLNTAGQVLAALQRVDVLLTNRLHGMVYALKAGTPPLVIDAIEGTAKVAAQARRLGWPACVPVAQATPERLDETLLWCRSPEAREKARACAEGARADLESLHAQFLDAMASNIRPAPLPPPPGRLSRWLRTRRR